MEEVHLHPKSIDKFAALLVAVLREGVGDLQIHPPHHAAEGVVVAVLREHLAQLRDVPRSVFPAPISGLPQRSCVPEEEIGVARDRGAKGAVSGVVLLEPDLLGLATTALDEEELRLVSQRRAELHDSRQIIDVDRFAVCSVDDVVLSVRENTADKAVVAGVVSLAHSQQSIRHLVCSEVLANFDLVSEVAEGLGEVVLVNFSTSTIRVCLGGVSLVVESVIVDDEADAMGVPVEGIKLFGVHFWDLSWSLLETLYLLPQQINLLDFHLEGRFQLTFVCLVLDALVLFLLHYLCRELLEVVQVLLQLFLLLFLRHEQLLGLRPLLLEVLELHSAHPRPDSLPPALSLPLLVVFVCVERESQRLTLQRNVLSPGLLHRVTRARGYRVDLTRDKAHLLVLDVMVVFTALSSHGLWVHGGGFSAGVRWLGGGEARGVVTGRQG